MRLLSPILFIAALAAAAPTLADARPDGGRGGWRGEGAQNPGGGRWGGGESRGDGGWSRAEGRRSFVDDRGDRGDGGAREGRGPNSLREGWREQQDEAREGVRQGRFVPLGGVLSELRRRQPGRQLDAGIEDWGGRPTYRVRWAAENGKRMDFIVDARTGAVLSVEGQ